MVRRVRGQGWTLARAADAAGVSVRTVSKWLRCYDREGEEGLLDRPSAPRTVANRTPEERIQVIAALRRLHMTGAEIAELLTMPRSTVSAILTRIGLGRLWRLEPREPANRHEKSRAGELVHVDVKKLGRIARPGHRVTGRVSGGGQHRRAFDLGWEFVHVAIDDAAGGDHGFRRRHCARRHQDPERLDSGRDRELQQLRPRSGRRHLRLPRSTTLATGAIAVAVARAER
jgi:transposase